MNKYIFIANKYLNTEYVLLIWNKILPDRILQRLSRHIAEVSICACILVILVKGADVPAI